MSLLTRKSNWPALGSGSMLSDFFDDERFFNSPWLRGQSMPAVNIREANDHYEVELAAPGYQKSDFNISTENGLLTISAEKKAEKEKKDDNYTRKEFEYSSFQRSFSLPENVSEEDIQARYEEGVLKLSIAKRKEQTKPRRAIDVK
jgi:HSP20 family protein